MQIRSSIQQLWRESRANPGFTALYIGGVAFAVAFTMVYAILFYVNLASVYPEYNRSLTSYCNYIQIRNDSTNNTRGGTPHLKFIRDFIENSDNIDFCSYTAQIGGPTSVISPVNGNPDFTVITKITDRNFFRLYDYEFLAGRPFNEAELEADDCTSVIITRRIAERLFGDPEDAVGREITVDYRPRRVVGVIRDGSPIAYNSYAELIFPISIVPSFVFEEKENGNLMDYFGPYFVSIKFKDAAQRERFEAEFNDKITRAGDSEGNSFMKADLQTHFVRTLGNTYDDSEELPSSEIIKSLILMLLILLLVPAINISGMIGGQMDRRMAEIGVRRSFGATRGELTRQVLFENFVLTLAGGLIGFVIAWIIIIVSRQWLLTLLISSTNLIDAPVEISTEMLFAPEIFLAALLICLLLNLLSAYIPVRYSLRRPIVSSLNFKR